MSLSLADAVSYLSFPFIFPLQPLFSRSHFISMNAACRMPQNQTVVVVEPPLNYKMVFDGPTNVGLAKSLVNPVSMALFPHVHGASVCAPLYDHYMAEDGLCYHL